MDHRIQVVLGEAEDDAGFLRFVLEGEGFDVVGLASSDEELDRILRGARPSVIVLDGGISAHAAHRAKELVPSATVVVVWPVGVTAAVADGHVAPTMVVDELGTAVRRAARNARLAEPRVDVAEELGQAIREWRRAEAILKPVAPVQPRPTGWGDASRRSVRRALVVAATWILILTALASIAVGIPNVFERGPARAPASPTAVERTHPTLSP
jgi:chemotaxis response regulator CheB